MEHEATQSQFDITSKMDFLVPLKQVGMITRSVLESITLFYRPRRIIVVSAKSEGVLLAYLLPYWEVGRVEFIDEETFFLKNYNLTLEDILSQYDSRRDGDHREPGWWLQQLLKLGACTQIPGISEYYVVWDGDLVPTRRWRLCERDVFGNINHFIAILQGEARSEFNTAQYSHCMKELLGYGSQDPQSGGTFVAHHMVFNKHYLSEMLAEMTAKSDGSTPWPLLIMSQSKQYFRFSEYKTYATFMLRNHPSAFHYHELTHFGIGGLRFREANAIVEEMLQCYTMEDGGLSYLQVRDFVTRQWRSLSKSSSATVPPAYVQLDHVYGLHGVDLRLTHLKAMSLPWNRVVPLSSWSLLSPSCCSGGCSPEEESILVDDVTSDECSTVVSTDSTADTVNSASGRDNIGDGVSSSAAAMPLLCSSPLAVEEEALGEAIETCC